MISSAASRRLLRSSLAALTVTLTAMSTAHAGRGPINAEHFNPQLDGRGLFNAESPDAFQQWQWGVGLMLHYARNPLIISDGTRKRLGLVQDRITANVMATLGLTDWLTLGAALPVALMNDQNAGLATTGGVGVTGFGSMRFQLKLRILDEKRHHIGVAFIPWFTLPTGNHNAFLGQNGVSFSPMLAIERHLGPVRLLANFGYTVREEARYFNIVVDDELFWRIALGVRVHEKVELGAELNGATAASSLFGSDVRKNPLELLLGARLLLTDRVQVYGGAGPGLSAGYGTPTFRFFAGLIFAPHERDTDGDGLVDPKDRCPLVPGPRENQGCPWPDTDKDGLTDNVDACPTVPGPKENQGCPWPDSDGDGVLDKDDRCPNVRGPVENQGCPWPDRDKDGVLDKDDRCPDVPGPADNNGCPWPDTDGDGVLDKDDRCPDVPGPKENQGCPLKVETDRDKDGILDKDDACPDVPGPKENQGCPWPDTDKDGIPDKDDDCPLEPGPASNRGCPLSDVVVTKTEIRILQQVFFKFGSAKILPKSFAILDLVVKALRKHPEIRKLEVQGHTDDVGSKKFNMKLSAARALSVRKYFSERGVDEDRLVSRGYGPTVPRVKINKKKMSKKALKAARAENRRVQFVILKQDPVTKRHKRQYIFTPEPAKAE